MLVNFRLRIMFLFLLILCIIGVIITLYQKPDIRLCFMDTHPLQGNVDNESNTSTDLGLEKLEDILLAKIQPIPGKSIFFHETSCPQTQSAVQTFQLGLEKALKEGFHWNMAKLNARQACAIESSALHNPNTEIFVLFASPRYKYANKNNSSSSSSSSNGGGSDITGNDAILEAILTYENVHLRNLNLWTYAANTPIYDWFKDGTLFKSRYVHLYKIS